MIDEVEYNLVTSLPRENDWGRTPVAEQQNALALLRGGDLKDALVCPAVWQDWGRTQESWFLGKVVEAAVPRATKALVSPVAREIENRAQELQTLFESIKPHYKVFSRRREVQSDSVPLEATVHLLPHVRAAIAEAGAAEWLAPINDEGVLRKIQDVLADKVAVELSYRFARHHDVLRNRDFNLRFEAIEIKQDGSCGLSVRVIG